MQPQATPLSFQFFSHACQAAYNDERFTPPPFRKLDQVFPNRRLFIAIAAENQFLNELAIKRCNNWKILKCLTQRAVQLKLTKCLQIHPKADVACTLKSRTEPPFSSNLWGEDRHLFADETCYFFIEVEKGRRQGKLVLGFLFVTLYREIPDQGAK